MSASGDGRESRAGAPDYEDPRWERLVDEGNAEREAADDRRHSADAKAERRQSRDAYRDIDDDAAIAVAKRTFPSLGQDRAYRGLKPRPGERIAGFVNDFTAVIANGKEQVGVVEATLPMRVSVPGRGKELVDLSLKRDGAWFRPAVPFTDVRLPQHLAAGIHLPSTGIGIEAEASADDEATVVENKLFYPNVGEGQGTDTDFIAEAAPDGVEVLYHLRSAASPETHRLSLDLPPGAAVRRRGPPLEGLEVVREGRRVATMSRPVAWDADRHPVSVSYRVDGDDIVLTVDHAGRDVAYPVLVDPTFAEHQVHSSGVDTTGWYYSEHDPYNTIGYSGSGARGAGLYVFQSPGAAAGNRGDWSFPAPGHSFIFRFEHKTAHDANHTNAQMGVRLGAAWDGFHAYDVNGTHMGWFENTPTQWYWSYSPLYVTTCLSRTRPCWPYEVDANDQPTAIAGVHGNAAVVGLMKNTTIWGGYPYVWAGETKIFIRDDTPPTVSVTSQTAPAGWVENASASVIAGANDSGFGVEAMRLNRGGDILQEQAFACPRARPQRCEPNRSGSFSYATTAFPDGINTLSVTAGDWKPPFVPDPVDPNLRNWSNPASSSWQVKLDRLAPAAPTPGGSLYQATRETDGIAEGTSYSVVVNASDAGSGVKTVAYKLKSLSTGQVVASGTQSNSSCHATNGCPQQWSPSFTVDVSALDGEYAVEATVTDQLNHVRTVGELHRVTIDHAVPTITGVSHSPPEATATWQSGAAQITSTVASTDRAAGPWRFSVTYPNGSTDTRTRDCGAWNRRCTLNASEAFSYTTDANRFPSEGPATVRATVRDGAVDLGGRESSTSSWTVKIDRTGPTIQASGGLRSPNPTGRDLHVKATDGDSQNPRSGVKKIELFIDRDGDGDFEAAEREGFREQTCPQESCSLELDYALPVDFPEGRYDAKIVAEDQAGNTSSDSWQFFAVNLLPSSRAKLGLEDFFEYDSVEAGGDSRVHVNAETGNVVWHSVPIVNPGRGLSTFVNLTYNSQDRGGLLGSVLGRVPVADLGGADLSNDLPGLSYAEAGNGFSISVSGPTRVNEPLGGIELATKKEELPTAQFIDFLEQRLGRDVPEDTPLGDAITLTDSDGTVHTFQRGEGNKWVHPPGVTMHLRRFDPATATPLLGVARKWAMTRPDGVTHFFDDLGYLTSTQDRNGNLLRYDYKTVNALDGSECPVGSEIGKRIVVAGIETVCVRRLYRVVDPVGVDAAPSPETAPPASSVLSIDYRTGGLLPETGSLFDPDVRLPFDSPLPAPGLIGGRAGRIDTITDHKGRTYKFDYDDDGFLVRFTEAANATGADEPRVTKLVYESKDPGSPATTLDDGLGQDRQLTDVVEVSEGADHARTNLKYYARSQSPPIPGALRKPRRLEDLVNRRDFKRQFTYVENADGTKDMSVRAAIEQDDAGTPTKTATTLHKVDDRGRPISVVDPLGRQTKLDWSADHRVTKITEAAGTSDEAVIDMTYTANGLLDTRTTHPTPGEARTTDLDYRDSAGILRSTAVEDGTGQFVSDLKEIKNPKSETNWRFTYLDDRGNPDERIDAKDNATKTLYDARGQILSEEDEADNVTRYAAYHPSGQPQVVVDPKQTATTQRRWIYHYDAVGNVVSVTDPRGDDGGAVLDSRSDFTTTLDYDAFDRLTYERIPKDTAGAADDYVERSRVYDRNGNLETSIDGNSKTTSVGYTKMDDPAEIDEPGSGGRREVTRLSYDGLDRLVQRGEQPTGDAPDTSTEYLLDAAGQRLAEVRKGASPRLPDQSPLSLTTSYAYDARGNVVRVLDPKRNGRRTAQQAADAVRDGEARSHYVYNRVDELVEERHAPASGAPAADMTKTRYGYDANGNRTQIEHPRRFDAVADPGDTGETLFRTRIEYDHRDQVVAIADPVGKTRRLERRDDGKVVADTSPRGVEEESGAGPYSYFTTRYEYDALGDVKSRSVPFASGQYGLTDMTLREWAVRYVRDEVGNPKTITDPRGNEINNTFFDTGDLKSTNRPSYWELDWDGGDEGAYANPDAGERFKSRGDSDPAIAEGGPRLVERSGRSANAERSEADPELPTSMGFGNFGSVDREGLGDLLPAAGATTFDYDGEMRLTDVVLATAQGPSPRAIEYDDAGRVTTKTWHFRRDGAAGRQFINHRFSYDGHGNLASFTDGEGERTAYEYDAFDRRVREIAPGAGSAEGQVVEPETTRFEYDDNGNLALRRTPRGDSYSFAYEYDGLDRLIAERNPAGETWRYCLDVAGNRIAERAPRGSGSNSSPCERETFDTRFEFDAADRVNKEIDPLGNETSYEYDADGNLAKVDAPGAKDAPGASEQRRITETTYDGRGLQWKQKVGTGDGARTTIRTFDANGNLRRTVNPKGASADPGDAASEQAMTKHATLRKYNADDLLTELHLPWGERDELDRKRYVQKFDRDSRGRVRSMFAPHEIGASAAEQTSYTHFENDWIRSSSDPEVNEPALPAPRVDKHLVDYDYDLRGNQTTWRTHNSDTPKGRIVTRTFWANGLLRSRTGTKVTDAGEDETSRRTYRYGYNANRSLVRMVDERDPAEAGDDRATTFGRDGAERETFVNETWSDGKDTRLTYDAHGNVEQRQTDGRWNGSAYVDSDAGRNDAKTTTFEYDRLDREVEMRVDHGDDPLRTTRKTYHPSGELSTKTSPNGVLEERFFNGFGEPSHTRRKRGSDAAGDWSLKDQEYGYDGNGNRTRDERGTHEFNARDQLVKWTRGGRNGAHGTTVAYELNASGAITKRTDSALPAGKQSLTYTYNGTRLAKVEDAESESTYSYDDFGNVIRIRSVTKVPGVPPPTSPLPQLPDACEALTSEAGETRYCYDEFERLVASKGPGLKSPAAFEYDGLDRRDRKRVRTATGDQMRDLSYVGTTRMLSRERDAAGQTRYYDYDSQGARQGQGSAPTTTPDPASYRSYGHDANGTVEEVQATDGAVSTEDRYRYDPYGELEKRDPSAVSFDPDAPESELSEAARENPFRFQGFYYDSGVKTYDMHARNYRPDTGRFLSQDRFESASGDFNLQADPLTQNRYVFGGANPVNRVEFDGHDPHGSDTHARGCFSCRGSSKQERRAAEVMYDHERTQHRATTGRRLPRTLDALERSYGGGAQASLGPAAVTATRPKGARVSSIIDYNRPYKPIGWQPKRVDDNGVPIKTEPASAWDVVLAASFFAAPEAALARGLGTVALRLGRLGGVAKTGPKGAGIGARGGESAAARYGREMHRAYDYGPGFVKEFRLPSRRRPDAVNFETREVVELKPRTPSAVTAGRRQLDIYRRELQQEFPGTPWRTRLVTYEPYRGPR